MRKGQRFDLVLFFFYVFKFRTEMETKEEKEIFLQHMSTGLRNIMDFWNERNE